MPLETSDKTLKSDFRGCF